MRNARLALALVAASLAVSPLTGCVITDHTVYPVGMPAPAVNTRSTAQVFEMTGASLFDAQHAVNRYLSLHYPQADLVRIHALCVGTNAKIAKTSSWEFTYRIKVQSSEPAPSPTPVPTPSASPSFTAQATTIPTTYQYHLLTFTYNGNGQLLAPEEVDDTGDTLAKIDFDRALLLSKAIDTALDIGMGVGDPGMEVTLRTTVNGGAVYELDSSVGTRQVLSHSYSYPSYPSYPSYSSSYDSSYDSWYGDDGSYYYPTPTPKPTATPYAKTAYVRGKYVMDAYTGAILDRPNRL